MIIVDYPFAVFRLGLALGGLALLVWRLRAPSEQAERWARWSLVVLALVGVCSYYYFFQLGKPGGFDRRDTYHYYVATKYAPELGYFRLYECSLVALAEAGRPLVTPHRVRNLRTLEIEGIERALARKGECKAAFAAERWEQFRYDVSWFRTRIADKIWARMMLDHGYNAPPVWTALVRPISALVPVDGGWFPYVARIDRFLIGLSFVGVAWVFGIEAAALMALAWASCFLWRYSWAGDAYVRHIWFAALLAGICSLRKGAHLLSGALLMTSTLLRIFPGAFLVTYGAHALRKVWRSRSLPRPIGRFAASVVASAVILLGASVFAAGRGIAVLPEFAEKILPFASKKGFNKVGLPVLRYQLAELSNRARDVASEVAGGQPAPPHPAVSVILRLLQLGLLAALAVLLWRALPAALEWEAAVLGLTLIPLLTQPTNYYYPFVVTAALLSTRRPRIGLLLLGTCIAWSVNGLFFYMEFAEFVGASLIAIVFSFLLASEMARPPTLHSGARHP